MDCQYYDKKYEVCMFTKYACYQLLNAIPIKENCQIFIDQKKSELEIIVEETIKDNKVYK